MQSVSTIAKVVSSNPTHGDTYSIQHYFIKFAYTKTDLNSLTNITLERVYINVAKCRVWTYTFFSTVLWHKHLHHISLRPTDLDVVIDK